MSYRAGFLGLIGQPNAGKSSLMNFLVEEKVSIVSKKPQTTRRRMLGLWSSDEGQIVFVDAPGLIKAEKGLNNFLAREADEVIAECDALVAVLSVDEKEAAANEQTLDLVAKSGKPWVAVVTKADLQDKGHRVLILKDLVAARQGKAFSISVLKGDRDTPEDREILLREFLQLLPESPAPLYDIELFTPETERTLIAEIIREKCFEHLHQEIPFGIAVRIIKFDEDAVPVPRLAAEIMVSKDNHKGMVIGKAGAVLKAIGSDARKDIEKLLGQKIFLEMNVIARDSWTENKRIMKELGYVHDNKGE
ncbi:MAG: GTPase Era [Bdellovibrionaceae bacterium]|nr:GTPase Era [Pseudobdellovibrionaceae bacterium]